MPSSSDNVFEVRGTASQALHSNSSNNVLDIQSLTRDLNEVCRGSCEWKLQVFIENYSALIKTTDTTRQRNLPSRPSVIQYQTDKLHAVCEDIV